MAFSTFSRKDSSTYLKWTSVELSKENRRQIAWDDSQIGAQYPISDPILAPHDRDAPNLIESDCNL